MFKNLGVSSELHSISICCSAIDSETHRLTANWHLFWSNKFVCILFCVMFAKFTSSIFKKNFCGVEMHLFDACLSIKCVVFLLFLEYVYALFIFVSLKSVLNASSWTDSCIDKKIQLWKWLKSTTRVSFSPFFCE